MPHDATGDAVRGGVGGMLTLTVHRKNWEPAEADVMLSGLLQGCNRGFVLPQTPFQGKGFIVAPQVLLTDSAAGGSQASAALLKQSLQHSSCASEA